MEIGRTRGYATLLDPLRQVVGFAGRAGEVDQLEAWCLDARQAGLRVITGPSGVGKTRLAAELGRRMATLGWSVDWLAGAGGVPENPRATSAAGRLIVADDADSRGDLAPLVEAAAAGHLGRVRLLLIAQSREPWWEQLRVAEGGLSALAEPDEHVRLTLRPPLTTEVPELELLRRAAADFAHELELDIPSLEPDGTSGAGSTVLELHAAALAVVATRQAQTAQADPGTGLTELLRLEQRWWLETASAHGLVSPAAEVLPANLRQLVAAACLLGAATEEAANALADRVPGLAPAAELTGWLRELLPPGPGGTEWIGQIRPERLAEMHVVRELTASAEFAARCLASIDGRQAPRVVRMLAQASARDLGTREALGTTLARLDDLLSQLEAPVDALIATVNAIPGSGEVLKSGAAALCQRIVQLLPEDAGKPARAHWLRVLGHWYQGSRRTDQAIAHTEKAVTLLRELALSGGQFERTQLATALAQLGGEYAAAGRRADALKVTEDAADLGRSLSTGSATARARLAIVLAGLGRQYLADGQSDEALRVSEEAVSIGRQLQQSDPARSRSGFASALTTLGSVYAKVGRRTEASRVLEEAVAVNRDLSARGELPVSQLAASLTSLGYQYAALDRRREAVQVTEEAVEIFRKLVGSGNDEHRNALTLSLISLGDRYWKAGHPAEAIAATEDAVAQRRILAKQAPGKYRSSLALSLSIMGTQYLRGGRAADAVRASEEAVAIYRSLDSARTARDLTALSESLRTLSAALTAVGRTADAAVARRDAERLMAGRA